MKYILPFLLFVFVNDVFSQSSDSWPVFRGNQQLTGISGSSVPDNPELLWTFQTGDNIKSAPVVSDGKIVIGAANGIVYCLDTNGKLIWKFETSNSIEAPALIYEGTVFIGNLDGTLYALDLGTGEVKWEYDTDNQIIGSANYWREKGITYILAGSYDYFLHCVNSQTGEVIWKYESDNFINGAPACLDGQTFFGGCDGFLHVVDIVSGQPKKKIDVATYVPGSPAMEKGIAYLGDYDGRFFQVDLEGEKTSWVWEHGETSLPFIASPAISGNRVVNANHNKFLYCFDKNTGKKLWEHNTGNRVEASPVIAGDRVIAANMRGDLILVNISDGKVVWMYELGSQIINNPAVAGGRIYVGIYDGTVYCFGK